MLTDYDIERIAQRVVDLLRQDDDLVTTEEAARILGVSARTMRRNKDKFRHVKSGDTQQGQLRFLRSDLHKGYGR